MGKRTNAEEDCNSLCISQLCIHTNKPSLPWHIAPQLRSGCPSIAPAIGNDTSRPAEYENMPTVPLVKRLIPDPCPSVPLPSIRMRVEFLNTPPVISRSPIAGAVSISVLVTAISIHSHLLVPLVQLCHIPPRNPGALFCSAKLALRAAAVASCELRFCWFRPANLDTEDYGVYTSHMSAIIIQHQTVRG